MREDIDDLITRSYEGTRLNDTEYQLVIRYTDAADLKQEIDELLREILHLADLRNCAINDMSIKNEATDRYWDECNGGWR